MRQGHIDDDDEDEELDPFGISERDIEAARNPYSVRRGFSKNQQIYGIWAEKEEEDDDRNVYNIGDLAYKPSKFSKNVNFVSGGVKYGDQIKKEDEAEDNEVEFIEPVKSKPRKQVGSNVFAGQRTFESSGEVPRWVRQEKGGLIMEMMKKMGYVPGKGLGIKEQGIVEPIEARKRPGRGALGAYGSEKSSQKDVTFLIGSADVTRDFEDEEIEKKGRPKKGNWKKTDSAGYKPKSVLKTVDDVLAENDIFSKNEIKGTGVKVIDMTGREQKVYSGYDAYAAKARIVAEAENENLTFDVPELRLNISTLLNLTENKIKQNDRQLRFLKDQTEVLQNEKEQLKVQIDADDRELKRLTKLFNILNEFFKGNQENASIESCYELFLSIQSDFFEEYCLFSLDQLAVGSLIMPIKSFFNQWNPLEDPTYGLEMLKKWRSVLNRNEGISYQSAGDLTNMRPFDKLLWECWMPAVRRAVASWSPREDPYIVLEIVNSWAQTLPIWMRDHILERVILPHIVDEVDKWNPTRDTVPIHTWLHPLLDTMGDRLLPVYAPIRQKLAKALKDWNPSDQSAISLLKPWKNVFTPATMSAFMAQNIIPKLEKALREMDFDPNRNKRYTEFHAVLSWTEMLGNEGVANILIRGFFPKWLETLRRWLDSPNVIQREVMAWYSQWKTRIPYEIVEVGVVKEQLMRGLMMMNQFRQGYPIMKQQGPLPPELPIGFIHPPPPPHVPPPPVQLTFKATEEGVLHRNVLPSEWNPSYSILSELLETANRFLIFGGDL